MVVFSLSTTLEQAAYFSCVGYKVLALNANSGLFWHILKFPVSCGILYASFNFHIRKEISDEVLKQ
jgi:hypothetical protein